MSKLLEYLRRQFGSALIETGTDRDGRLWANATFYFSQGRARAQALIAIDEDPKSNWRVVDAVDGRAWLAYIAER